MHVMRSKVVSLRVRVTNPGASPTVAAYLRIGPHVEWRTLDTRSTPGASYETEWKVGLDNPAGSLPPSVVPLRNRLGEVTVGAGFGPTADAARNEPALKQLLSYRIDGSTVEVLFPNLKFRTSKVEHQDVSQLGPGQHPSGARPPGYGRRGHPAGRLIDAWDRASASARAARWSRRWGLQKDAQRRAQLLAQRDPLRVPGDRVEPASIVSGIECRRLLGDLGPLAGRRVTGVGDEAATRSIQQPVELGVDGDVKDGPNRSPPVRPMRGARGDDPAWQGANLDVQSFEPQEQADAVNTPYVAIAVDEHVAGMIGNAATIEGTSLLYTDVHPASGSCARTGSAVFTTASATSATIATGASHRLFARVLRPTATSQPVQAMVTNTIMPTTQLHLIR